MTIFGAIWTFILLICMSRRRYNASIFMLLFSSVLQCDSIFFFGKSEGIGTFLFTCILVDVRILIDLLRNKRKFKTDKNILLFFLLFASILISYMLNHLDLSFSIFLSLAPLIVYFGTYFCLLQIADTISRESFDRMLEKIVWFVIIIGIMQYLIALKLLPNLGMLKTFIYNEVGTKSSLYFANPTSSYSRRLYSTFMEPSYCAAFLSSAIFFVYNRRKKHIYPFIILCLVEVLLTRSSTAYGCLFLCAVVYLIQNARRVPRSFIYIGAALLLIVAVFTFTGMVNFDSIIFHKSKTGSGAYRIILNNRALNQFHKSPIWGIGYKRIRASSIVYSVLGELGIIGIIVYALLSLSNIVPYLKKEKRLGLPYEMWFFAVVSAQIMSCPDLDFCLFWFALYVILFHNLCGSDSERSIM